MTSERARMRMTERRRRKSASQKNNKMAGSRAGSWAPLPCLTPSASGRARERAGCLAGWRRDGVEEKEREEQKTGIRMGRGGVVMQAAPPGSPVMANDAELEKVEGGGGL